MYKLSPQNPPNKAKPKPISSFSLPSPMASHTSNTGTNPAPAEEESGWTAYLDDLSPSDGSFISISPSLVSDAAWNGPDNLSHVRSRLNFKNLKKNSNKKYCSPDGDDDLEDTASSPVNSPKVSENCKQNNNNNMEVNYTRFEHDHGNFLGKRGWSSNLSGVVSEEKNGKKVENIDEFVDLRKRGLCLVPMATFINFLG